MADEPTETTDWREGIEDEALRGALADFATPADLAKSWLEVKDRPEPNGETADWRAGIEDKKLAKAAEKFASPAELLKSYAELETSRSQSIKLPGKGATEEELAEFNKKLGVPADVSGYKITRPEDLPEHLRPDEASEQLEQAFLERAHKAGYTPAQAQEAIGWWYDTVVALDEAQTAQAETRREESEATLKREWGQDYDANTEAARRAATSFGDDNFTAFLEEAKVDGVQLGNHPMFVKAFAAIGRRMTEGNLVTGLSPEGEADLDKQIDTKHEEIDMNKHKWDSRTRDRHEKELQALYSQRYGDEPIVGERSRAV